MANKYPPKLTSLLKKKKDMRSRVVSKLNMSVVGTGENLAQQSATPSYRDIRTLYRVIQPSSSERSRLPPRLSPKKESQKAFRVLSSKTLFSALSW